MPRGPGCFASFAVLLATLGAGCAADSGDGAILVLKNVHADESCATTGIVSELSVPHGSLELLFPSDYLFIAQMESRIVASDAQLDTRTIITRAAKVDIAFPNSDLFTAAELAELEQTGLTHFRSNFSTPLFPNGGIADGGFVLIPKGLVERVLAKSGVKGLDDAPFRVEVEATFTVEGDMSGATVHSQPFTYGVTLGNNVSVSPNPGTCPLPSGGTIRTGYACNPFQDGVVDCCTSPAPSGGTNITCPGSSG